MSSALSCPCQTGAKTPILFSNCCQKYIENIEQAKTAEQLMRSRYSAFVMEDEAYLLRSWHASTRPPSITFDSASKWIGLKIVSSTDGTESHQEGWVKFIAKYKISGKAFKLEEHSYFTKEAGNWRYVSAENTDAFVEHKG